MHEWIFENTNVAELLQDVREATDGEEFRLDITTMNWDDYIRQYMFGIRKYVLKDDLDSLPAARRTMKKYVPHLEIVLQKFKFFFFCNLISDCTLVNGFSNCF